MNKMLAMGHNAEHDAFLEKLSWLPVLARILRSVFIGEKKPALSREFLLDRLTRSTQLRLSSREMDDHLEILASKQKTWIKAYTFPSGSFIKLNMNYDINKLVNSLEEDINYMHNKRIPLIHVSPDVHIQSMMTADTTSMYFVEADTQQQHQPTDLYLPPMDFSPLPGQIPPQPISPLSLGQFRSVRFHYENWYIYDESDATCNTNGPCKYVPLAPGCAVCLYRTFCKRRLRKHMETYHSMCL